MPRRPTMKSQSTQAWPADGVEEALERVARRDAEGEEPLGRAAAVDPGGVRAEAVDGRAPSSVDGPGAEARGRTACRGRPTGR